MFSGKLALVTGGSRGIGLGICRALHTEGAKLIVIGKARKYLDDIEDEIPGTKTIKIDLADWDATEKALSSIEPLDFLINNAAVWYGIQSIEDISKTEVSSYIDTNIKAVINVTKCALPLMKLRGPGACIVNISGSASTKVQPFAVFGSTKTSIDYLTKCMAVEFGKYNIRVNAINPGFVPDTDSTYGDASPIGEAIKLKTPTGKNTSVSDCADLVLFLLSDKAKSINGTCLIIDGGRVCNN